MPTHIAIPAILLATLIATHIGSPSMPNPQPDQQPNQDRPLSLGNFSISLAVKDIAASRAFYEKLGFHIIGGNQDQNWLVMQSDTATIGLFQGMFENNILTFNPGWDRNANTLPEFTDIRDLQAALRAKGIEPATPADPTSTGPASLIITDPDGNTILIDQHTPRPGADH